MIHESVTNNGHTPVAGNQEVGQAMNGAHSWRAKLAGVALSFSVLVAAPACSEFETNGNPPTTTEVVDAAQTTTSAEQPTDAELNAAPADAYQSALGLSVAGYETERFADYIESQLYDLDRADTTVADDIQSRRRSLSGFTYDSHAHDYGLFSSSLIKYDYRGMTGDALPIWYKDIDSSDLIDQAMPVTTIRLEEGELFAVDGRPPSTRTNEFENSRYDEFVGAVIAPHAAQIESAIAAGKLNTIEIVINTSPSESEIKFGAESSYYDTKTKDIVIMLPSINPQRHVDTESTLVHELAHAMVEGDFAHYLEETPGAADLEPKLRAACSAIRKSALDNAEKKSGQLDTLMEQQMALDPTNAEHWQAIRDALAAGRLENIQWTEATSPNGIAECYIANPNAMIGVHKNSLGITESGHEAPDLSDEQIDNIFAIREAFSSLIRSSNVLQTISEHGYIADKYTGHPEDGSDELAASLVALATQYPKEFAFQIKLLDDDARAAVLDAYAVVREVYVAQDTSYAEQLPTAETLIDN